jgi:hypothetical protein
MAGPELVVAETSETLRTRVPARNIIGLDPMAPDEILRIRDGRLLLRRAGRRGAPQTAHHHGFLGCSKIGGGYREIAQAVGKQP